MEQPNNDRRRTGQSVAFYTALAVCLIAVGVGTWQLLRPEENVSAVSSAVSLPEEVPDVSVRVAGPDPEAETEPETPAEDVSTLKPATKSDTEQSAPDTKQSASDGDKAASDTKQSASGGDKAASDTKQSASGGKKTASDTKQSASGGKKTTSDTKQSASKENKDASDANKTAKPSGEGVRPVEGETVTGFSMDKLLYNETMRDWRTHDGIDIAADAGTAVAAARAGTVESVTADPIMGTTVVIRHADKWESVYSSLTDMPEAEAGDEVTAGQIIGYVGETAASEAVLGPHLHFTVLNDGAPVDPATFLP